MYKRGAYPDGSFDTKVAIVVEPDGHAGLGREASKDQVLCLGGWGISCIWLSGFCGGVGAAGAKGTYDGLNHHFLGFGTHLGGLRWAAGNLKWKEAGGGGEARDERADRKAAR